MTWLPWTLEYTKRGIEFAAKKAADAVAEAATQAAPPADAAENPYAKWYEDSDRVTDTERAHAQSYLEGKGFTNIHLPPNGVYYGQRDEDRWADIPYPKDGHKPYTEGGFKRTIGGEGCAPSALAIADATLRPGTKTTPPEVAQYARDHHASGIPPRHGSNTKKLVEEWAAEHGLDHKHSKRVDDIVRGLDNHGVAVVNVKGGIFNQKKFTDADKKPAGGGGHEIVVIGYALDKEGQQWFFIANPGKGASATRLHGEGVFVDTALHHGAGRVRVSREVLEKYMKNGAHVLTNPNQPSG